MPERRVPTLAEARRQARWRGTIGGLLIGLSIIFLLLVLVKHLYLNVPRGFFSFGPGRDPHTFIDSLLRAWPVLAWLWRALPSWQPIHALPTAPLWEYVYAIWGAAAVALVGGFLRWSAHKRRVQISKFFETMQQEDWREQVRAARGLAPDDRGATTVIGQAIWYQYAAPSEPWSQTTRGILILGLIVGLVVGLILLCAEYGYFQPRWPSNRN
jgi:hypothetical protein